MTCHYFVETLTMTSGERLAVLRDSRTGMPLFAPTVYSLTQLRARNLASRTIELALRHLLVLQLFLEHHQIDLGSRFREGKVLNLGEAEALANTCGLYCSDITSAAEVKASKPKRFRADSLENFRQQFRTKLPKSVASDTKDNRIRVIADYLSWQVKDQLLKLPAGSAIYQSLDAAKQITVDTLKARISGAGGRNTIGQREGLPRETIERLLSAIAKNSPENPWTCDFTKTRNELMFRWLYAFGLRRGELLNVCVSDIDFRKETFTIVRRADSPDAPRKAQPLVKTRDRILPMSPDLCRLTYEYVVNTRRLLAGARSHGYLFVATKTGAPMSLSTLNKCFSFLRTRIQDLPDGLSPHVMRHTWNDNFSEAMDRITTQEADEQKMRSYLMGWSETSGTAVNYTRRHNRRKANQISLLMQSKMTGEDDI